MKKQTPQTEPAVEPSLGQKALSSIFNRRNGVRLFGVALLVDQFGYAGEGGAKILNSNSITHPAAAYYQITGQIAHFSWENAKDFATELNDVIQRDMNP